MSQEAQKLNILFICDEYPPGKSGGVGTSVRLLARSLVKSGHRVFVSGLYTYAYGQADYEEDEGVKVWRQRYGIKTRGESFLFKVLKRCPAFIRKHLNGQNAYNRFIQSLHLLIASEKIELMEVPDWNNFAMHIGFKVSWPAFPVPLVLKAHGSFSKICRDLGRSPSPFFLEMDRALYLRADAITAVSKDTAKSIQALFGQKNIEVIHNGIETQGSMQAGKRKQHQVIYAGSLTYEKGVYQLIKAWNLVILQFPEAKLMVYGKGKTEPLYELLNSEGKTRVEFKGFAAREEILKEMAVSTMAVLPSFSETFGLVAIEAMSVGCPVIYTNRASGPEIIQHGVNGLLADPADIKKLSGLIMDLMNDAGLQNTLSINGKQSVDEKFSIEHIASKHVLFYKKVIEQFSNKLA